MEPHRATPKGTPGRAGQYSCLTHSAPSFKEKGRAQAFSQKVLVVASRSQAGSILAIRLYTPWHKSLSAARVVVLR